ncbi:610_t:CDS:2 [Gigaspora margarita]|uniref:610_t:CDS:1 n=1 Tax=Gigaspora margarita TaxID=4874 RepID=A0ABN7W3K0_GIGMA|nr:610_t:CDS:2 [Gigaspora margarita]
MSVIFNSYLKQVGGQSNKTDEYVKEIEDIMNKNFDKVDRMIDDEHQNDKAIVLMEALLKVVIKMDTMMEGLLETLKRWKKLDDVDET